MAKKSMIVKQARPFKYKVRAYRGEIPGVTKASW